MAKDLAVVEQRTVAFCANKYALAHRHFVICVYNEETHLKTAEYGLFETMEQTEAFARQHNIEFKECC